MSVRLFSTLFNKLSPHTPGCPTPVMLQFIRDAAIEVCKQTLAWRYEQDDITLVAGEYVYPYEPPTQSEVCSVIFSALDGTYIPFVTEEQLHAAYPAWPDTNNPAQPLRLSQLDVDNFVVAPVPDDAATYTLKLFLALCPKPDATYMDTSAFDELEDIIVHSTLYRLFSLPDRSWSNADLAEYHKKQCAYKLTRSRANANLSNGRAPLQVRMVPFGA